MTSTKGPVVFIHGLWLHASSWQPWQDLFAEAITKSTLKQYRHSDAVSDLVEFTDRGHSLTIDAGWREVAEACLSWLTKQGR